MYESPASRVSRTNTPPLRWKFEDRDFSEAPPAGDRDFRRLRNEAAVSVSARKLGAALWQLAPEVTATSPNLKPCVGHLRIKFPIYQCSSDYGTKIKPWLQKPMSSCAPKCRSFLKYKSAMPFPKFAMEGATKWDPGFPKSSTEVHRVFSHTKLLNCAPLATASAPSHLQVELVQSRAHIQKLETQRRSFKKKIKQFLKKLNEEHTTWSRREHQKVRAVLDDIKNELNTERRNCQRIEAANSKLFNELADFKLSAKKTIQDYEKERKARKLMEEVCNDLARKVEEDKSKVEALKKGSVRIREEVEEKRKMLQMAEVWREERVQVKLVDARLVLEEKYKQISNLITDLETFLKSRNVTHDLIGMSKAGVQKHSNGFVNDISSLESSSGLETVTHAKDEGSSYYPHGSDHSVNRISRGIHISTVDAKLEQKLGQESFNSQISGICSTSA